MAEAMSEENLAMIRTLSNVTDRSVMPSFVANALHIAVEEIDRLRARLAEIGETREEWYVRWPAAGGGYTYELCEDEQDAREAIPDDDKTCEIVRRLVGDERQVER